MAEDKLVVTVEQDAPAPDEPTVVKTEPETPATPASDAAADLAVQLQEMKARETARDQEIARERDRANRAEADARRAATEAQSARVENVDSRLGMVVAGLEAAEAEAAAAEVAISQFTESGNFAEATKAYRRLASAEAKITRLNDAKSDIEGQIEAAKTQPRRTEQPADPVEAFISSRSPASADWLRAHRDWVADPKKNAKLTAAHYNAVGDGLREDTPEYFEAVETFIGLRQPPAPNGNANGNGHQSPKRKAAAPVAPVASTGGGMNGGGGNEVRLSKSEAAAATDGTLVWNYDDNSPQKKFRKGDPIGIQEFARRKKAMTEQGLYDKSFVEQ